MKRPHNVHLFFFFNDTATTEIYTLSLHDALPISVDQRPELERRRQDHADRFAQKRAEPAQRLDDRSEEHTSELQSQSNLVCRLLLEKKKYPSSTPLLTEPRIHLHRTPAPKTRNSS